MFLNKNVQATVTSKNTFSGILRMSELDNSAIELHPADDYESKRYGAVIIVADSILAIREIIPRSVEEDDYELKEAGDCDVAYAAQDTKAPSKFPSRFIEEEFKDKI